MGVLLNSSGWLCWTEMEPRPSPRFESFEGEHWLATLEFPADVWLFVLGGIVQGEFWRN